MTLGSRRSAGTRAILREIPVPVLGPLSPLNRKAAAKVKANVKARTPLAAQVEDPTGTSQGNRMFRFRSASSQALVKPEEQRINSEVTEIVSSSGGRSRSNTTSSVLTTASSSSSIPTITITETSNDSARAEDRRQRFLTEPQGLPTEPEFLAEAEFAEQAEADPFSGTELRLGSTSGGLLRASASSVSLSGALPSTAPRTTQHLTGTSSAPVPSASSARLTANTGRYSPGVELHRDPRLITVSSHVPQGDSSQPLSLHLLSHCRLQSPPSCPPAAFPSNCTSYLQSRSLSFSFAIDTSKFLMHEDNVRMSRLCTYWSLI